MTSGEAMAGAKVQVETVTRPVLIVVPKGSYTGTIPRLRGKGVPSKGATGDHLIELQVFLPDQPDDMLVQSITAWEAKHAYNSPKKQGALT